MIKTTGNSFGLTFSSLAAVAFVAAGALLMVTSCAHAKAGRAMKLSSADAVELVQTVPLETDLAHPALRHAHEVWQDLARNARETIDLGQFYVQNRPGERLEDVILALEAAAKRGVKIRLIIADTMAGNDAATYERIRQFPGAEGRIISLKKLTGGIQHAKYWIVDGRRAFVGSQNFDWKALTHIHEMGVLTESPVVVDPLKQIFEIDWAFAGNGTLPPPRQVPVAPVTPPAPAAIEFVASPAALTPDPIRLAEDMLVDLLKKAAKRVRVQLLSYHPVSDKEYWPVIDGALRSAAARGVKVQLMVSHWDQEAGSLEHLKSLAVLPGIEVRIVRIPEHSSGPISYSRVIHSKYMTVDGTTMWIGTSNWSKGYFRATRGIEIVLRDPAPTAIIDEIFEKLWNEAYTKSVLELEPQPSDRGRGI